MSVLNNLYSRSPASIIDNMPKIEYTCEVCSGTFIDYDFKKRKFCSHFCSGKRIDNSFKGKHHTPETKKKLSEIQKNNEKIKVSQFKLGHNKWDHPNVRKNWIEKGQKPVNYAGGTRSFYQKIKDDSRYHRWQKAVLGRDNFECQDCGDTDSKLDCHHLMRVLDYPKLAFELSNGVALCKRCHIIRHGKTPRT